MQMAIRTILEQIMTYDRVDIKLRFFVEISNNPSTKKQPQLFEECDHKMVDKLHKSIYILKQASRAF